MAELVKMRIGFAGYVRCGLASVRYDSLTLPNASPQTSPRLRMAFSIGPDARLPTELYFIFNWWAFRSILASGLQAASL